MLENFRQRTDSGEGKDLLCHPVNNNVDLGEESSIGNYLALSKGFFLPP